MNNSISRNAIFVATGLVLTAAIGGGVAVAQSRAVSGSNSAGADTYRLVQVGANALPALLEQEGDCTEQVVRGSLTLNDGSWTLITTERETCETNVEEEEERTEGSYTTEGTTLRFGADADDDNDPEDTNEPAGDIDLEDLRTGSISGNTLSITLNDGVTVLRFDR